jgi:hypothetical protein
LKEDSVRGSEKAGCAKCYITSPFGGGKGYGMFHLPQVNSCGIVEQLEGRLDAYVWLGTLYKNIGGSIDLPEENGIENSDILENTDKIMNLENALVITTKRTILENPLDAHNENNKIDWFTRPVENVFVLDNEKVYIAHNILDSNEQSIGTLQLRMDNNGISMDYTKDEQSGSVTVVIDPETKLPRLEISTRDTSKNQEISINGDPKSLTLLAKNGDTKQSSIILSNGTGGSLDDQGIHITSQKGDTNTVLTLDGGKNAISLSAKDIVLNVNGGKISLGNGTSPVAVYTGGPDELSVQPSDNVFA